jgi:hypothetical protein
VDEQADREHTETADEGTDWVPVDGPHDPALAGSATTETGMSPAPRSVSVQVVIGLCLLVLGALQGVGSFLAWLTYSEQGVSGSLKGITNWRGFGWITLVLAIAIVVVIVADLVQPTVALKAVTAALFGASGVVATYYVLQYCVFPTPGQPSTSVGWGSGLIIGAGVAGLGLGSLSAMLARPSHRTAA